MASKDSPGLIVSRGSCFLHQVTSHPIGFTVYGFFVINKEAVLTVRYITRVSVY